MPQSKPTLECTQPEVQRGGPLHPPILNHDPDRKMEENNANHDIQDPQDRYNVLQRKTWILNQGRLYLFTPLRRGHDAPLFWRQQQHHQADQSMVKQ